jgi:5-oxoprolinase (ATP-hydrolysing) subunit A
VQRTIDLNCDLGEGAGHDAELLPLISSANIACGAHAGTLETMIETVEATITRRVGIGAHPGYFDLDHFGRQERDITPHEAGRLVLLQVEQLHEVAGSRLRHVKLHGALYNQVCGDAFLAEGVVADLARLWPHLIVFALAGSQFAKAARARGLRVAQEAFADRTYRRDGSLTPRSEPNSLITDVSAAVAQVLRMVREGIVRATDGTELQIRADTICIHGDGQHAVTFARQLNEELAAAGIGIKSATGNISAR